MNVCISVWFVCAEVVSGPVWRVSGILGTKRERKGGEKRRDAPPAEHSENSHGADAEIRP